ncbi:MAG: hypothetical protein ABGX16_14145 [Pirellulales bacterium]
MRLLVSFLLLSFCMVSFGASSVLAIPPFQKVFKKYYSDSEQFTDKEKGLEFAAKVKEAKCFVCHDAKEPKKKKERNRYGDELSKLLDKKKDKKNKEKVVEALKKVAAMHIDPKDENSSTYGDLIKAGKLPGGKFVKPEKK